MMVSHNLESQGTIVLCTGCDKKSATGHSGSESHEMVRINLNLLVLGYGNGISRIKCVAKCYRCKQKEIKIWCKCCVSHVYVRPINSYKEYRRDLI